MENLIQEQLANYVRFNYPDVLFRSDLGGIRLTMGQAARAKRLQSGRAWPDMYFAVPSCGYHGLFVELKRDGTRIYLKDGVTLVADRHIQEQAEVLSKLNALGYKAVFAVGFSEARKAVDEYLGQRDNDEVNEAIMNGRVDHYAA